MRSTISSQTRRLSQPMSATHQIHLQTCVDQFMGGLYGIRKFMTTPIPFPLVQMAHTMGLVYVYTLPFVFLKTQDNLYASCFNIFLLTKFIDYYFSHRLTFVDFFNLVDFGNFFCFLHIFLYYF